MITDAKGYVENLLSFKGFTFEQHANMIRNDFTNGYMEVDVAIECMDLLEDAYNK